MEINKDTKVIPIADIFYILDKDTNIPMPAAKICNEVHDTRNEIYAILFNPTMAAATCVALYEAFLNNTDESIQVEFEKEFLERFHFFFETRGGYVEKITKHDL